MIVVDASVAIKWLIDEAGSDDAERIARLPDLVAPDLLLAETGNALWKKARKGEIASAAVPELLDSVLRIVDDVYEIGPRVLLAYQIAEQLDHSIYDCIYIALAQELGVRLVTADAKLATKCRGGPFADLVISMAEAANGA